MRNRWVGLIAVLISLAFGVIVYPELPGQVATHWDVSGEVDDTMARFWAVVSLPLLGVSLWGLMMLLPRLDPRRGNYEAFQGTYYLLVNAVLILLAALQAVVIASGLGYEIDIARLVPVGVGLLLAILGNEMGRIRPNWFTGIRTPWTLADDEVWRRTHRFAAKVFVLGGVSIAVVGFFLPGTIAAVVTITAAVVLALIPAAYSYIIWRQRQQEHDPISS